MTSYIGMNLGNGRAVTDAQHLAQSVYDILTTPIGSRVERREYGSDLPNLIDQPLNEITRMKVITAIVIALIRWEPRLKITRVDLLLGSEAGQAMIEIFGIILIDGLATQAVLNYPVVA